jgi:hypothetical protein
MKASELRIGNLIKGKSPEKKVYEEPVELNEYYFLLFLNNMMDVEPIPLTEEWLLKFGFKHQNKYDLESNLYSKKLKSGYFFTIYSKKETLDFKTKFIGWKVLNIGFDLKIDFVNQLQNLHFALTGEELTLKNKEQ